MEVTIYLNVAAIVEVDTDNMPYQVTQERAENIARAHAWNGTLFAGEHPTSKMTMRYDDYEKSTVTKATLLGVSVTELD